LHILSYKSTHVIFTTPNKFDSNNHPLPTDSVSLRPSSPQEGKKRRNLIPLKGSMLMANPTIRAAVGSEPHETNAPRGSTNMSEPCSNNRDQIEIENTKGPYSKARSRGDPDPVLNYPDRSGWARINLAGEGQIRLPSSRRVVFR